MIPRLEHLLRSLEEAVTRASRAGARWVRVRWRRLWSGHLDHVAHNAAYASAAGALLGGLLGFVPVRDVIATLIAAVLGVYVNGQRRPYDNGPLDRMVVDSYEY